MLINTYGKWASIAKKITDTRKAKGIKAGDLYRYAGIKSQTVRNWGVQNSIPSADTAIKIADYLGVSVKWLILGEDDSKDAELLNTFHHLNDEGKDNAILLVKALVPKYPLSSEQAGASSKMAT